MAQPEQTKTVQVSKICVVSMLDHIPAQHGKATTNPSLSRIVVDRTARDTIRLTLFNGGGGDDTRLQVPTDQGGEAIVRLLTQAGADFVVVSCNGDVNLDPRAIAEVAAIGSGKRDWAIQYDLALGDRSGFGYSFADFVQYRMIDLEPPLPQKAPSILGNLLLRADIFVKHAGEIALLPSATVWHRLMALRLVSLHGAPLELPIIAGWRRHQFGLGRVDSVRHNVARLSAFLDQTLAEAASKREQPGSLLLLLALQDRICRLLFPNEDVSSRPELPDSARRAIDRSIDVALTDRAVRLGLAADIVDQMSLSSLKGLEYASTDVERRIGASLQYAIEMNAFTGLEVEIEKLNTLAQLLLGEDRNNAEFKASIAPNIPLLVSALSQSKSSSMRDMLIDNLSRLGESMDETSSHGIPELRIARLPVESRGFSMAMFVKVLRTLNLVPIAIRVRDQLRRLKLVS